MVAQLGQFCEQRRTCQACGAVRRLHDSHCSNLKTIFGAAFYCRDRWKACVIQVMLGHKKLDYLPR